MPQRVLKRSKQSDAEKSVRLQKYKREVEHLATQLDREREILQQKEIANLLSGWKL
jgi:hypothetical protein